MKSTIVKRVKVKRPDRLHRGPTAVKITRADGSQEVVSAATLKRSKRRQVRKGRE